TTTVGSAFVARAAEPRRRLSPLRILLLQDLDLRVEARGLDRGERLALLVLVLLGEQVRELIGDAGADPHIQGAPPEPAHRFQAAQPTDKHSVWSDGDRLEQSNLLDRTHQGAQVAEVAPVTYADDDRIDLSLEL